jgi:hypothetical protein
MRQMKNTITGAIISVTHHAMTQNYWEYYIYTTNLNCDIATGLVMGFETELGDIYLPDVRKHALSITDNLTDLLPAQGWEWIS